MRKKLVAVKDAVVDPATSADLLDSHWWQRENGAKLGAEHVAYGINRWERNGFVHVRLHHTADKDKSPLTEKGRAYVGDISKDMPIYSRRQEYGIDFTVTPGKPVYCDFGSVTVRPQVYRPWLTLFRGWDFGWRMPAAIHLQVESREDGTFRVYALKEVIARELLVDEFADKHVLPFATNVCPGARIEDYCDPAGNQHDDRSPDTSIEVLQTRGVYARWRDMSVDEGIQIVQWVIKAGWLEIDPVDCKHLVDGLRNGLVRDKDGFPLKDGFYEHICDAFRYALANIFRLKFVVQDGKRVQRVEMNRLDLGLVEAGRRKPLQSGWTGLARPGEG